MVFNNRKNNRLKDYDYSTNGGYFITICTYNKRCMLSHIVDNGECMSASAKNTELGNLVEETLIQVSEQYGFLLDSYVVMPNHIHLIVFLQECNGQKITVGRFVGAMKSIVVHKWIDKCNARGIMFGKLWQRNYYEHILRNEQDYLEKRNYIECNPDKWRMDSEYTEF